MHVDNDNDVTNYKRIVNDLIFFFIIQNSANFVFRVDLPEAEVSIANSFAEHFRWRNASS
jgi:hypothetical protein